MWLYLFNSLAELDIKKHLSIILTGMGKDGSQGLLRVKEKGAMTFAQDEESSVIFGMPRVAIEIGAAKKIISLDDMATEIVVEYNKLK
jgi:two-component system chemotaxis response regulator CheB